VNTSTLAAISDLDLLAELPLREVLPGILMFTLPVDYGIDHVNIYLIRDGQGWCLFDTGADCEAARALWLRALEGPLAAGLTRIIVSHHHPDHLGLAVWLHERTGAPILMREEELTVARQTHVASAQDRSYCIDFMCRHGLSANDAQQVVGGVLQSNMACAVPARIEPIEAGQKLRIGDHVFDVLVLGGHSIAQVCLYEPSLKLLLTGDQLLERITPNIGVWPYGETDPLPRYLDSLRTLAGLAIEHVLPAHHDVYHAGVKRAHGLVAHHQRALRKFLARLGAGGMSATELGCAVYGAQSDPLHAYLAMGETLAHLLWLERPGYVRREETPASTRWYPVTATGEEPTLTLSGDVSR
jgi:glyoxylase-like metal-dependent hydrolase (beta-lactamase superfamily II)